MLFDLMPLIYRKPRFYLRIVSLYVHRAMSGAGGIVYLTDYRNNPWPFFGYRKVLFHAGVFRPRCTGDVIGGSPRDPRREQDYDDN